MGGCDGLTVAIFFFERNGHRASLPLLFFQKLLFEGSCPAFQKSGDVKKRERKKERKKEKKRK
jgi:hypothetical protein